MVKANDYINVEGENGYASYNIANFVLPAVWTFGYLV